MRTLTDKLESAQEAMKRLKPFPQTSEDITYFAADSAEVMVFLDTVLPSFLAEIKSVTEEI